MKTKKAFIFLVLFLLILTGIIFVVIASGEEGTKTPEIETKDEVYFDIETSYSFSVYDKEQIDIDTNADDFFFFLAIYSNESGLFYETMISESATNQNIYTFDNSIAIFDYESSDNFDAAFANFKNLVPMDSGFVLNTNNCLYFDNAKSIDLCFERSGEFDIKLFFIQNSAITTKSTIVNISDNSATPEIKLLDSSKNIINYCLVGETNFIEFDGLPDNEFDFKINTSKNILLQTNEFDNTIPFKCISPGNIYIEIYQNSLLGHKIFTKSISVSCYHAIETFSLSFDNTTIKNDIVTLYLFNQGKHAEASADGLYNNSTIEVSCEQNTLKKFEIIYNQNNVFEFSNNKITAKNQGESTITIKSLDRKEYSYTFKVLVKKVYLSSLSLIAKISALTENSTSYSQINIENFLYNQDKNTATFSFINHVVGSEIKKDLILYNTDLCNFSTSFQKSYSFVSLDIFLNDNLIESLPQSFPAGSHTLKVSDKNTNTSISININCLEYKKPCSYLYIFSSPLTNFGATLINNTLTTELLYIQFSFSVTCECQNCDSIPFASNVTCKDDMGNTVVFEMVSNSISLEVQSECTYTLTFVNTQNPEITSVFTIIVI